jgi:hypothetical protein
MGKSWGTYPVVPPIQKFLRTQRYIPPTLLITSVIPLQDIFGTLPTAQAPTP